MGSWVTDILKKLGGVIDAAAPVAVGNRTKIVVVLCAVLPYAAPLVPPPYTALVPIVQSLLCGSAPLFAAAGLVRETK